MILFLKGEKVLADENKGVLYSFVVLEKKIIETCAAISDRNLVRTARGLIAG